MVTGCPALYGRFTPFAAERIRTFTVARAMAVCRPAVPLPYRCGYSYRLTLPLPTLYLPLFTRYIVVTRTRTRPRRMLPRRTGLHGHAALAFTPLPWNMTLPLINANKHRLVLAPTCRLLPGCSSLDAALTRCVYCAHRMRTVVTVLRFVRF